MEAAIVISALLAAAGIGAVGVGYSRATSAQNGTSVPDSTFGQIGAVAAFALGVQNAMATFASYPNYLGYGLDPKNTTLTVETSGGIVTIPVPQKVNQATAIRQLVAAVKSALGSATTQSGATQSGAGANAQATANAVGTSTANLDRLIDSFVAAGFTLDEAEADAETGVSLAQAVEARSSAAASAEASAAAQSRARAMAGGAT
jgi:hypothetical protein